ITPAISCSKASSQPAIRLNSGVKVPSALGLFLLPLGRPGRRLALGALTFLAAAFALLAAFSASLRITGSTRSGNARRAWTLTSDRVKKANPGTGLPYSNRSPYENRNHAAACDCISQAGRRDGAA